jgi:hypothetical protein
VLDKIKDLTYEELVQKFSTGYDKKDDEWFDEGMWYLDAFLDKYCKEVE